MQFVVYFLQNFKVFITRQIETPSNKWIEANPIITKRKFLCNNEEQYELQKTKYHNEYGIDNVRSDEDYFDSLILSFVDEYNYNIKLDEYLKQTDIICGKCLKPGHYDSYCNEEEDAFGHTIYENLEFSEYEEDLDDDSDEESDF